MTAGIWTERFRVRSYEITPRGTASVLALADYLQEAAGHHAAELGVSMQDLLDDGRAWVLARLRLKIDRLPKWEDDVVVETWPSGLDRLYATREFVLHAGSDEGNVMARGTSAWLVIDTDRRRPLRPPAMLHSLDPPDRPPALAHDVSRDLPPPERADAASTFTVRYHDLDVNRHVNNVRYLEWALETLPADVLDARRCQSLQLQFSAETTLGDTVRATAQIEDAPDGNTESDALRVRHRLTHAESDRVLATATTQWAAPGEA